MFRVPFEAAIVFAFACAGCSSGEATVRFGSPIKASQVCVLDSECDDGLVCSGLERCVDGRCFAGRPPVCDDGDVESEDRCIEPLGCTYSKSEDGNGERDAGAEAGASVDAEPAGTIPSYLPDYCSGALLTGDVIASEQPTLDALQGVRCIDGSLTLLGPGVRSVGALSALRFVDGDLKFSNVTELESLGSLDALEGVRGDLTISGLRGTTVLAPFPSLKEVSGNVTVTGLARATRFSGLSSIEQIGGNLEISGSPLLSDLSAALLALRTVGGSVSLAGLPEVEALDVLNALVEVGGDLSLSAGSAPELFGFRALERVGYAIKLPKELVVLGGFDHLKQVGMLDLTLPNARRLDSFHSLEQVRYDVRVDAPKLVTFQGFDVLSAVRNLTFANFAGLTAISGFDRLGTITGELRVTKTSLRSLPFKRVASCTQLTLMQNPALTDLDGLTGVRALSRIMVVGNHALLSLAPLDTQRALDALVVRENLTLSKLGFARLEEVHEILGITANPALSRCEVDEVASKLSPSHKTVEICCNSGCESCSGRVCVKGDGGTAGQSTHHALTLTPQSGDLRVFANVESAKDVTIDATSIEPVLLSGLKHITGTLVVGGGAKWRDVSALSGLEQVDGGISIYGPNALETLSGLGRVRHIGRKLQLYNLPKLRELALRSLERVGTEVIIQQNFDLSSCVVEDLRAQLAARGCTATFTATGAKVCSGECEGAVCK